MKPERLTEILHDAQDASEDLAQEAIEAVNRVVAARLPALLEKGTVQGILAQIVSDVEGQLADVTSDAVRLGFYTARKIAAGDEDGD